jgi:phosphatidylglycerol phospholipase C
LLKIQQAVRWDVDAILTDVTQTWLDLRSALHDNYDKTLAGQDRSFLWTYVRFWAPLVFARRRLVIGYLQKLGGPFRPDEYSKNPLIKAVQLSYVIGTVFYGLMMMKIFPPNV